ncbi:uncharacterized protein [Amphiura filiformis]|uniref:uncharacterized protein n=1 Tax=Amphiura filiformis TaxID=82378 RepID=UPI003B22701B
MRLITDIDLRAKWKRQPRRKYFVRRKANEDLINEELSTFKDKYFSMGNVSVQEKWDNLESEIKTVMNKHIPQKTAAKPNSLPWFKRSHHRLRRRKQRAFNKAKKSQSSDDWKKFLSCQKELKKSLNESEREFVANNLTTAMKENTKQFWSYMKRLGKSESGVADLKVNNNIISDGKEKAEALNAQFASVFTREDKEAIPTLGSSSIQDIPDLIIHEKGVLKQLQELSPNKAAGPDEIPPWFLKMFAEKLAPIFTDLFQASVDQGTLPINGGSFGTRGFSALAVLDFSKAFDKVPHERLLNKLHHYGIRNNLHQWIRSFLSNRTQRVACEGNFSSPKEVLSGVPQGTVLGPLLFLTYINDLPDMLSNQVRLFADDCLVYSTVSNERDMDSLQADLKSLETWQETWKMSFNPSKCTVMEISLKRNPPHRDYIFCGQVLQQPNSNPYLGVQLDNKLNWGEHVTNTVNKANRTLGFLRRNLWFCPGEVKSTAYLTLVRPVLEYAAGAWDPYRAGLIKKIESVQRKAARFCTGDYQRESSVTQMLEDLGWDTLAVRRERNRLAMFYKIQNELVGINKEAYIQTSSAAGLRRNHHLHVEIPFIKKDVYKNSFFPRTGRAWNSLTQTTISAPSLDIFKKNL